MKKAKTSAKLSEIKGCLCRQFMPYRMTAQDEKRPHGVELTLGCMMCGRTATGDSPRECVDNWNATNSENALKPAPVLASEKRTSSRQGAKQKLNRKGTASRKGAVVKRNRDAAGHEQPRLPARKMK